MNELSLRLNAQQSAHLERYAELVRTHNERAGLVSRGDLDVIEQRHFAESFALLQALEERSLLRSPLIDIGSGAGFPGVPAKIARPELRVTLLEATVKKAAFLELVCEELALADVQVVALRAEEAARLPRHRAKYALALARAVAPLPVLLELALPFLADGGVLAAPKGSAAPRELAEAEGALRELGGTVEEVVRLEVAAPGPAPTLILVRKSGETPERYPRRAGIPRKRPL